MQVPNANFTEGGASGRDVDVLTFSHVVCRPTEKEAQDYLQHFAQDNADWEAVDNLVRLQFAHAQSFPHDLLALIRDKEAAESREAAAAAEALFEAPAEALAGDADLPADGGDAMPGGEA